jgi:hypothetical protein
MTLCSENSLTILKPIAITLLLIFVAEYWKPLGTWKSARATMEKKERERENARRKESACLGGKVLSQNPKPKDERL